MRVLIIKTSSMGDIIHTFPSLTDAMQIIPNICFDWVVEENFSQIPTWHKGVNQVLPVAIRRWRQSWWLSKSVQSEYKVFQQLVCSQYYDVIIDAQGLLKSAAIITRLTHGVKHGMDWKSIREPLASFFYDYRHRILKQQHAIERTRELFAKSLGYKKPETYADYAIIQHFSCKICTNNVPYIIFLHATTRNNKHWPETHWRKLIQLLKTSGVQIKLVSFTRHEKNRAERLSYGLSYVEALPTLSLVQTAKQIINAHAVISVDTGLSHLTAALNKPNIILFGPTKPSLIGGYGRNQYPIISRTKKMSDITADEVFVLLYKKRLLSKYMK